MLINDVDMLNLVDRLREGTLSTWIRTHIISMPSLASRDSD